MLLTAIKEMRSGKGASVNAIFTYIRTTFRYDLLKNRNHIRRTLMKLIDEGLVDRVKGRGLAGSFKLGKKYKESKKTSAAASKFVRTKDSQYVCAMLKYKFAIFASSYGVFPPLLVFPKHRQHTQENVPKTSERKS